MKASKLLITLSTLAVIVCSASDFNSNPCKIEVDKGMLRIGFKPYQTFDEFKMSGSGNPVDSPFVYVKVGVKQIDVVKSNNIDSTITYNYQHECWHNRISFTSNLKPDYQYTLNDLFPTVYDRHIYQDTIIEEQFVFTSHQILKRILYMKTKQKCVIKGRCESAYNPTTSDGNYDVTNLPYSYQSFKQYDNVDSIDMYLMESDTSFYYVIKPNEVAFEYPKTALGLFGLQPGVFPQLPTVDERMQKDGTYLPRIMPKYRGGDIAIINHISQKTATYDGVPPQRNVVIRLLISREGAVKDVQFIRYFSNDDCLKGIIREACFTLPIPFIPGINDNGEAVDAWYTFAFEVKKEQGLLVCYSPQP
ncbi:MAG TPA: hypothetical protein DCQ56_01130 [Porphyromonadaceae bacterium]|nr:hypothetical protein [Porphyromonadaceae bacterium]